MAMFNTFLLVYQRVLEAIWEHVHPSPKIFGVSGPKKQLSCIMGGGTCRIIP